MRAVRSDPTLVLLIFFLVIAASPSPSQSLSFYHPFLYARRLLSLSRSLLSRVSDLRTSRGDLAGAQRARALADKLDLGFGLGFWRMMWAASWDLAWRWREFPLTELYGAVSDMNELMRGLSELSRLESAAERSAWAARNYQNVLSVFKSLSAKLIKAFGQSGLVREVMETVRKEVVEGGLIRDCLELGSNDLKELIQLLKDLVQRFYPASDKDPHEL